MYARQLNSLSLYYTKKYTGVGNPENCSSRNITLFAAACLYIFQSNIYFTA